MAESTPINQRNRSLAILAGAALCGIALMKIRQRKISKCVKDCRVEYLNNPNEIYQFTVDYKGQNRDQDLKHVAKVIVPGWSKAEDSNISIKIVCGGITNLLFRLTYGSESLLIRIYGEKTEAIIDRERDNWTFAELSKMGFGPTYYGRFANGRVEQWLDDARPLQPEEMGQMKPIDFCRLVAREIATMHLLPVPGDKTPRLWKFLDGFISTAMTVTFDNEERKAQLVDLNLQKIKNEMDWLKTKLPSPVNSDGEALLDALLVDSTTKEAYAFAGDVVFAHNDLLSGNMIYNEKWDRIRIIDYEYGGYNYRGFDLANHFCEHCGFDSNFEKSYPSMQQQMRFFRYYLEQAAPALLNDLERKGETQRFLNALYQAVNRFVLASHFFWGIWAIVQAKYSPIDFDFLNYARLRFTGYYYHKTQFFSS